MKIAIIFPLLAIFLNSHGQQPAKHDNTIEVSGVSFPQVVNALLDAKFDIGKKDDVYFTVKTEFTKETSSFVHISLAIRVKDSVAYISGIFYNQIFGFSTSPIEYTPLGKKIFLRMDNFAKSLNGQVTYTKR